VWHPSYRTRNQQLKDTGNSVDFAVVWQNRGIRKSVNHVKQTIVDNGPGTYRWIKYCWGARIRRNYGQTHHRKVGGATGLEKREALRRAAFEKAQWTIQEDEY
jgi:hypothetical protein